MILSILLGVLMMNTFREKTGLLNTPRCCEHTHSRGFSLIELIVVLAITALLMALLMPGLSMAREGARRLMCSSNERQIGVGFALFAKDENEKLPKSHFLDNNRLEEMMALSTGDYEEDGYLMRSKFDGIGHLLMGYVDSNSCFFCPSYCGHNTPEQFEAEYPHGTAPRKIYSNYHYTGHKILAGKGPDGEDNGRGTRIRVFGANPTKPLLTDGLRIKDDFSHKAGMNVLLEDLSVNWQADIASEIFELIPITVRPDENASPASHIEKIWKIIKVLD
jgi:prepilin-type N-terminal cleavage/methylation domain-containing protein